MEGRTIAALAWGLVVSVALVGQPCGEADAATIDFKVVQKTPHQMVVGSDIEYEVWAKVTDETDSAGLCFFSVDVIVTDPAADPSDVVAPQEATFVSPFDTLDWAIMRSTGTLSGDDVLQVGASQDTMDSLGTLTSINQDVGHGAYVHLFDGVVETADAGTFSAPYSVYVGLTGDLMANVLDEPLDPAEPDEKWTVNAADETASVDVSGITGGVVTGDGFETVLLPEPATLALVGLGGLATLLGRRKARR